LGVVAFCVRIIAYNQNTIRQCGDTEGGAALLPWALLLLRGARDGRTHFAPCCFPFNYFSQLFIFLLFNDGELRLLLFF
jgi:hypothetical protein